MQIKFNKINILKIKIKMIYKKQYIDICSNNVKIKLFNTPNWLDIVTSGNWDVIPIKVNDKILGLLPYVKKKRFLLNFSVLPKITQHLSPIVLDNKLFQSNESEFYYNLSKQLNKFIFFRSSWLNSKIYDLETLRKYFSVNISKSYVVTKSKKEYSKNASRFVNKIKENDNLVIREEFNHEKFYLNYCNNLKDRGLKNYYDKVFFLNLLNLINKKNIGKTFVVENKDKKFQSGAVVVWDNLRVYMIILTTNHKFKNAGGSYLLIDYLIDYSFKNNKSFDFEGGNIKSIEDFYRNFTKQTVDLIELSKKSFF